MLTFFEIKNKFYYFKNNLFYFEISYTALISSADKALP